LWIISAAITIAGSIVVTITIAFIVTTIAASIGSESLLVIDVVSAHQKQHHSNCY
jgi:hypothetical protein